MHTPEQQVLASLRIERTGVPIYVQIREQVLALICAGALTPGQRMPTMRQVAVALRIDLNTVRHAYEELERAGALELRRGLGSFVTATPQAPAETPTAGADLDHLAGRVIALAGAAGVDPLHLAERVARLTKSKETPK